MSGFPGVDTSIYPGQAQMSWLKTNTNLLWTGYYLAPAPSHSGVDWMGQREALQAEGWGLAPTYLGQQLAGPGSHEVSATQGTIDGNDAAILMAQEGFTQGAWVYLDLEDGAPFAAPRTDYVANWISAVQGAGFQAGIYCSHAFAPDVHNAHPDARVWAYKVSTVAPHPFPGTNFPDLDPAGCGYTGAYMWQLGQNCRLSLTGAPTASMLVDLNSAVAPDPSAP